jgi:glycerol-3-phosphate responsive antiterminator
MILLGLVFLIKTKYITYIFDKNQGIFTVKRSTIFQVTTKKYGIDKIKEVYVDQEIDSQGGCVSGLFVEMSDGTRIKIFNGQMISLKNNEEEKACNLIKNYIKTSKKVEKQSTDKFTKKISHFFLTTPKSSNQEIIIEENK